jgi:CzcA family heavy metal efflux pump
MKIGLSSKTVSQMDMTTLAKWTIRPRLTAIPGVANVAIWGQRDRQLQVLIDPDRLRAHNLSLDDVVKAAGEAVSVESGGFIDTPNQRLAVTHTLTINNEKDLAEIIVTFRNGAPLRLGDVADIIEGTPPPIGNGIINDGPGLLLIVEKQPWGNTLDVTYKVEEALNALMPALNDIEVDSAIFRPATYIEMSLYNLNKALLISCLLVIIVLAFFMYEWRTALISASAIPLSLITAALILDYRGGNINTMVLAGMVIALGEVVDDAIIDVENIMRRLRLRAESKDTSSIFNVVLNASLEVRSSVIIGSLIVILVLLPIFFLDGLAGTFFRPLALSYVTAIIASLLVALTVTPALSMLLLPKIAERKQNDSPWVMSLKKHYSKLLPRLLLHASCTLKTAAVFFVLTLLMLPLMGEEFLPNFKEYDFLMHWVEKPGTSIEAMDRITIRVSKELRSIPGVRNFGAHIGRAEVADEVVGPNFTELWISLDPAVEYDAAIREIQEVVDGYPGLYRDLLTYLRERIKEVLTGASASIVVRIYGPNLDILQTKAETVKHAISGIQGVTDLKVQPLKYIPHIQIKFRADAAARFGLTPGKVRDAVTTLIKGKKVGEVYEDQMIFDVVVWGTPDIRNSVADIHKLQIDTPTGAAIPLAQIADIIIAPVANKITRESASRRIDVTCNVSGRDLAGVAEDIQEKLNEIPFDSGYYPELLGEYVAQQQAKQRILAVGIFSLIGIFLILHADFKSIRQASLVFLALPFALTGSILSVMVSGGILSLGSIVGFVTVIGIAGRNGIMLISHYRHLQTEEQVPFGLELILRGAEERLVPILMTALTTALALLPLIIGGARPGQEIEYPMAIVILGGLITSTLLNLLLIPILYMHYGQTQSVANNTL